jgi:glucosylceramidase
VFLYQAGCLLGVVLAVGNSSARHSSAPAAMSGQDTKVEVYESTSDLKESLQERPAVSFGESKPAALTINVNESVTYQQMDGFGASITDSSGWLLHNKLSNSQRKDLMEKLFDPVKGIGLSFLRQPMGASDFALKDYSYDDRPAREADTELTHFSIDADRAYIIPVLREALAINPRLKIMASPWSPPGWMKSSGSLIQGTLLKSAYPALANYFVKFVQAYAASGVPIYAVTMQNEPRYIPVDYPGMGVTADEQISFLRDHLGPAFRDARLKTKVLVFDHNWDLLDFPLAVLSDSRTADLVAGTAVHCYGGAVTAQTDLHNKFPAKDIWETECSGGEWQKGDLLRDQAQLIIGVTRNWSKSVVLWNLALDQANGPHTGGCGTCRGLVTIKYDTSPTTTTMTVDYVALGHISKFVAPGAFHIDSNTFDKDNLEDVAFQNPDGSIVLLALNTSNVPLAFNVHWSEKYFTYTLPAGAFGTFRWHASPVRNK